MEGNYPLSLKLESDKSCKTQKQETFLNKKTDHG